MGTPVTTNTQPDSAAGKDTEAVAATPAADI